MKEAYKCFSYPDDSKDLIRFHLDRMRYFESMVTKVVRRRAELIVERIVIANKCLSKKLPHKISCIEKNTKVYCKSLV
jgi:hypothetical protein